MLLKRPLRVLYGFLLRTRCVIDKLLSKPIFFLIKFIYWRESDDRVVLDPVQIFVWFNTIVVEIIQEDFNFIGDWVVDREGRTMLLNICELVDLSLI